MVSGEIETYYNEIDKQTKFNSLLLVVFEVTRHINFVNLSIKKKKERERGERIEYCLCGHENVGIS